MKSGGGDARRRRLADKLANTTPSGTTALTPKEQAAADLVYIGSFGRSGSTLLAYLLGQVEGFFPVGELRFVWERGLIGNEKCGCGERFHECDFWRQVGKHAFGGWDGVDVETVVALQRRLTRRSSLATLVARPTKRHQAEIDEYAEVLARLYRAVQAVAGCDFIVDSGKLPLDALLLRFAPEVRLRVIHLVRDSRGVAFSWSKRNVRRPEATRDDEYMEAYSPQHTGVRWTVYNGLFDALAVVGIRRVTVRYESLVTSPQEETVGALQSLDVPVADYDFSVLSSGMVELGRLHTIAGNPMRFHRGQRGVRLDEQWRCDMDPADRRLVFLLTWPLLLRYGYLSRKPVRAHAAC